MSNFADEEARHERWQTEPDDDNRPSASDLAEDARLSDTDFRARAREAYPEWNAT